MKLWFAVLGGIAAWLTHLTFVSSWVQFSCNEPDFAWVSHAVTAATAAITVVAMTMCVQLLRAAPDNESVGTPAGRTRFLAQFGILTGAINLALILAEGSYVSVVYRCG